MIRNRSTLPVLVKREVGSDLPNVTLARPDDGAAVGHVAQTCRRLATVVACGRYRLCNSAVHGQGDGVYGRSLSVGSTVVRRRLPGRDARDDWLNRTRRGCRSRWASVSGLEIGFAAASAELGSRAGRAAGAFGARVAATRNVIVVGSVWRSRRRLGACVYVRRGDGSFGRSPTARLTVNFPGAGDLQSVAISGSTIVIGDPLAHVGANAAQGAAYVFARPKGGWRSESQTAVLTAGSAGTRFGQAVGVFAGTIVATSDQKLGDGLGLGSSVSYVYQRPAGGWRSTKPVASLAPAGESAGSAGVSVAVSKTTIAVGQPLAGMIAVYARPVGGWRSTGPSAILTSRSDPARDELGQTIAMNANTIAASTLVPGRHPGYWYSAIDVFTRPPAGWRSGHPTATLTAQHQNEGNDYGFSLAMNNSMILAGGPD